MSTSIKEHPIIFSSESVRAILEGRKTQTRRVIKPQPTKPLVYRTVKGRPELEYWYEPDNGEVGHAYDCPYGQVGNRLWVRETFRINKPDFKNPKSPPLVEYRANSESARRWSSPLYMPRWASRITLEITEIWVERLQEITEGMAKCEGVGWERQDIGLRPVYFKSYKAKFIGLWDSLNAKRGYGWETNPLVWVIGFKKVAQ